MRTAAAAGPAGSVLALPLLLAPPDSGVDETVDVAVELERDFTAPGAR